MSAGIYLFQNKINEKCYVGKAQSLRKRLKHHFSNIKTQRYDLPLYRAVNKYGIENFKITILKEYPSNMDHDDLCKQMDQDEIYYIEKYNGYTNGYNCTLGGDGGILGYKMTDEQKDKISRISKTSNINSRKIYMYNVKEKYYITACSISYASQITNISISCISRVANKKYYNNYVKHFLCNFSKEELNEEIKNLSEEDIKNILEPKEFDRSKTGSFKLTEDCKKKISESHKKYKYIELYDKNMNLIKVFRYKEDVADFLKCSITTVRSATNGAMKTCKGYIIKQIV